MDNDSKWHSLTSEDALLKLNSSSNGLASKDASERLLKYGLNELKEEGKATPFSIFVSQLKNVMTLLLAAAVIISLLINELVDAIAIIVILVLNVILGFVQEYRAEKAMEALKSLAAPKAVVIRDGVKEEIPSTNLVPGDIVLLEVGSIVPANLRIIEESNLKVDQAHLTGESIPVSKSASRVPEGTSMAERDCIAFMGSVVVMGSAMGVVIETGMNTEIGKIAKSVSSEKRESTPLQNEIKTLSKWLAGVVVLIVTAVFVIGLLSNQDPAEMLLTSVSLAVSAVPEGLPTVITITLALGMQRMASKKAIVRKLAAVQTLGSVTIICSDKTGTLTKNEMTVTKVFDGIHDYEITGSGYNPEGKFLANGKEINPLKNKQLRTILAAGVFCNNAYYGKKDGTYSVIGDPTEGCLLALAAKAGIWSEELSKNNKKITELSFSSERKRMSVLIETPKGDIIYSKGAPDVMLGLCTKALINGKTVKLTNELKKRILSKNTEMAGNALRVLALAYKKTSSVKKSEKALESELILLGLVGMIDPPRTEIYKAVELTKKAGIRTVIITGDYKDTAIAIAKNVGLFETGDIAFSGDEIDKMTSEEFSDAVRNARIFARVSPDHKLKIVQELKKQGEIIAVTGDGVNDAPALKTAHIGIAMGRGTDVSKEASEMVLADENFSTIVNAIEEGRGIFDNVKKFLKFLLASNTDTILIVLLSIILKLPLPYLPLQILWMNLITDGFPALALSVDAKNPDLMNHKPRDIKKKLIAEIAPFIIFAGLIDALSSITVFFTALSFENYFINPTDFALAKARTMAISSAIIYELFVVFNCRDDRKSIWSKSFSENFLSNKGLTLSVIASIVLQLFFIYNPLMQSVFKTVSLSLPELGIVFFFASWGLLVMPKWFNKKSN